MAAAAAFLILVGGYSNYISSLRFTPSTSTLTYLTQTASPSATWLTQHPSNSSIIYAAKEVWNQPGAITTMVLNPSTGSLKTVATINTGTANGGTVYVEPINNGTALAAADFTPGTAMIVPLGNDRTSFSGTGQVLKFVGSGPLPNQASAHAHQTLQYNDEILVADLGSDLVRRLTKSGNSWSQAASISFPPGHGPRHMVVTNNTLYTIHQNYNSVTQNTLPAISSGQASQLVANVTTVPPGTTSTSNMQAAELLYAESPCGGSASPLLYASNRGDPSSQGDAITVFEITPQLKAVAHIRTGMQQVRGMSFVGPTKQYIVAGGTNGGGVKVYERTCQGYLTQKAALNSGQITDRKSVV